MSTDPDTSSDLPTQTDLPQPERASTIDLGNVTMTASPCGEGVHLLKTPALETGYGRYTDAQTIGAGGVGTVSSRLDPNLGRHIAMKELHPHLDGQCEQRIRFFREARVTAQLQHPNIIPVHEMGESPSGSFYFTMKRVKGLSLQQVLASLRSGSRTMAAEYPRAKLIDIFVDICQAVAFAHSREVIHRDLKPENILLGDFGETLVTDWGLVKILGQEDDLQSPGESEAAPPEAPSHADVERFNVTTEGSVSGTPLYMSPEQAMGQVSSLDQRSDIYSLGAILYEMLTLERAIQGKSLDEVMQQVITGTIEPPKKRTPKRNIPCDLSAICMKALRLEPEERYASVPELLADLRRYQRGLPVSVRPYSKVEKLWKFGLRHPVISSVLMAVLVVCLAGVVTLITLRHLRYTELMRLADNSRLEGVAMQEQRLGLLQDLQQVQEQHLDKVPLAREERLQEELAELTIRAENAYRTAVMLYVMAADGERSDRRVNAGMSAIFTDRIEYALQDEDWPMAEQWLALLQHWLGQGYEQATPQVRETIKELAETVKGDANLQVSTQPSGANVSMQNLDRLREETPAATAAMGTTPIPAFDLPKGRYLLTIDHPDRPAIRYPLLLRHGQQLELVVRLPRAIPPQTVYVPEGNFLCGGPQARHLRLHERHLPAFFLKRQEVTFGEYLAFWREVGSGDPSLMSRVQLQMHERQFRDAWDEQGELIAPFQPGDPVIGITREAAARYCRWLSSKRGREHRLPTAAEWEKAARGVDGRPFVWGDTYHEEHAFTLEHRQASERYPLMAPPGSFPRDVSLYGASDLAGNVREWTGTPFPGGSPFYQIKGASFATTKRFLFCSYASDSPVVPTDVGFRYVVPIDEQQDF